LSASTSWARERSSTPVASSICNHRIRSRGEGADVSCGAGGMEFNDIALFVLRYLSPAMVGLGSKGKRMEAG
jgi:hypothetical protein